MKTKIPKVIWISMIIDGLLLAVLLYLKPPVSTLLIFGMFVIGAWGIMRLARWAHKEGS